MKFDLHNTSLIVCIVISNSMSIKVFLYHNKEIILFEPSCDWLKILKLITKLS